MPVIKQVVDGSLAKRRLPDEVSGPTGPVGPDGAQGPAGYTGPRGYTAFRAALVMKVRRVVLGRAVTLGRGSVGDTGPVGYTGPRGDTGVKGATGVIGDTGVQGRTGSRGETGDVGRAVDTGPLGYTGPCGETGCKGQPVRSVTPGRKVGRVFAGDWRKAHRVRRGRSATPGPRRDRWAGLHRPCRRHGPQGRTGSVVRQVRTAFLATPGHRVVRVQSGSPARVATLVFRGPVRPGRLGTPGCGAKPA